MTLNDKWITPGSKCDLCKRPKREGERWWDTHCSAGISGFTFNFCPECEKDRQAECDNVMGKALSDHIKSTREYWDTHPVELAKHNRETKEYREKCLDADGHPWVWPHRPWYKKIWNWVRRKCGYKKKYRYYVGNSKWIVE